MTASGNWFTMPDAMLDASYQAYNGYRIGRPDKAFYAASGKNRAPVNRTYSAPKSRRWHIPAAAAGLRLPASQSDAMCRCRSNSDAPLYARTDFFVVPVQMHQRQFQPVIIRIATNQIIITDGLFTTGCGNGRSVIARRCSSNWLMLAPFCVQ